MHPLNIGWPKDLRAVATVEQTVTTTVRMRSTIDSTAIGDQLNRHRHLNSMHNVH
jgi:hypothetical protein